MSYEDVDRLSPDEIEARMGSIKKMLLVGAAFAAVGYLLIGAALVFEVTQFHPLLENYFTEFPNTSLAGGSGGERGAAVNAELTAIHKWPSTLLWLKLGGVGHILVGIFIALAAIIRVLSLVPHRLSYAMEGAGD
jgi:hypothetical protein